ncbi:hypothetical protein HAP94_20285 [Acidithiobacillus ferrivorans]|nr:hypothetical protein [Acidithiobacillus ferrivorans]
MTSNNIKSWSRCRLLGSYQSVKRYLKTQRNDYKHNRRKAEKCESAYRVECHAYACLTEGFAKTNLEISNDKDLNMLIIFSSTFNSDDLPPCPWAEFSKDQYFNVHKCFRSPWIARAANIAGFDRFRALALKVIGENRSHVEAANSCDDSDLWNTNDDCNTDDFYTEDKCKAETHDPNKWDHDEYDDNPDDENERWRIKDIVQKGILKHYPRSQLVEKFKSYDWRDEESVKITAAHARSRPINNNNPRTSASFVPHRQAGGSNADGDGDGDGEPPRSFRVPTPPIHQGLNRLTHSLISGGAQ